MNERRAFWNKVISGKYEKERGGWCSREVREGHEESINHILLHYVKTIFF